MLIKHIAFYVKEKMDKNDSGGPSIDLLLQGLDLFDMSDLQASLRSWATKNAGKLMANDFLSFLDVSISSGTVNLSQLKVFMEKIPPTELCKLMDKSINALVFLVMGQLTPHVDTRIEAHRNSLHVETQHCVRACLWRCLRCMGC